MSEKIYGDIMDRKLFIINLSTSFNKEKFYELSKFVSQTKLNKINEHQNCMDKKLSLYAEIAVKLIIAKELKIDYKKISIVVDELGKPYIENERNINFNISHAKNIIVIGISNNSIGVDIEFECINGTKIAERFFTRKEYEYIKENVNPGEAFLEIWTKKEAYIKCSGIGLRAPLNSFCVLDTSLKDKFITFKRDIYVVNFYDGISNKELSIIELMESEIENLYVNY